MWKALTISSLLMASCGTEVVDLRELPDEDTPVYTCYAYFNHYDYSHMIVCPDGTEADVLKGDKGEDGINGSNGTDGVNGRDGIDGVDGADGNDGDNGRDGVDGIDGQDGLDGQDGADGRDGVDGVDGQDGAQGIPGDDGMDGVSCSVQQMPDGAHIYCEDGSEAYIYHGKDAKGGGGKKK